MAVGPTCQKTANCQNALFFPSMSIHGLPEQESPRLQRRGTSANFPSAPLTDASWNLHRQKRPESSSPLPLPGPPAPRARIGRGADLDNLAIYCSQSLRVRRACECQRYSSRRSSSSRSFCVTISPTSWAREIRRWASFPIASGGAAVESPLKLSSCQLDNLSLLVRPAARCARSGKIGPCQQTDRPRRLGDPAGLWALPASLRRGGGNCSSSRLTIILRE